jgi:hypothetical protein
MLVVIKVADDALQAETDTSATPVSEISEMVRSATGTVLHQMSSAGSLRNFFWVDAPDVEMAGRLVERLRELRGVEAAYVKPPDDVP